MKLYIAGGWDEIPLVRTWMGKCREQGIDITEDWTADEARGVHNDDLTHEQRKEIALRDYKGVKDADVFWLIVPEYRGARSAFTEFGIALAQAAELIERTTLSEDIEPFYVFVSGGNAKKSIFTELPWVFRYDTHEEAFAGIAEIKRRRAPYTREQLEESLDKLEKGETAPGCTEEDRKKWFEEAGTMTLSGLTEFISRTMHKPHDYNSVVYAVAASAYAAAKAADRHPGGGITGFQAGGVMWEFIKAWLHIDGPMRLVKYQDMLYPQYENDFTKKTISSDMMKWLVEQAKKELVKADNNMYSDVRKHLMSIAEGKPPFGYVVEDWNV